MTSRITYTLYHPRECLTVIYVAICIAFIRYTLSLILQSLHLTHPVVNEDTSPTSTTPDQTKEETKNDRLHPIQTLCSATIRGKLDFE
jgi:hypothetical protein